MSQSSSSSWRSQTGFVWSLIGSAVGFANILSFSAQAYKNGGGAFLIPYMIALFVLGIPMLYLEGMIGNKWQLPIVGAYGKKCGGAGKVLGWLSVIACLTIGSFYIVLTGYSAAYTYFSVTNQIPIDSKTFFLETFLKSTPSIREMGAFSWPIFIGTLIVALISWFVLVRQVKDGIEKICSIFMPLLALIILVFAITVCFLPGGMEGWVYYLKPDFSRLNDPALWRDVFGQLFFSLSLGLGIIVGYSRYTKKETNIAQAMIWVAIGDFAVSFMAGFAIFGCLSFISHTQNIPFDAIVTSDSTFEIGFILFPKILQSFGPIFSPIIGTIFFFCLFIAGITGVFSIIESITGNLKVEFRLTRKTAVTIVICSIVVLATLFCMGNGSHIMDAIVPMVLGTNMLISGLFLVLVFVYRQSLNPEERLWGPQDENKLMVLSLRYIAPVILGIILIANLWQEGEHVDLLVKIRWGWLIGALLLSILLVRFRKNRV